MTPAPSLAWPRGPLCLATSSAGTDEPCGRTAPEAPIIDGPPHVVPPTGLDRHSSISRGLGPSSTSDESSAWAGTPNDEGLAEKFADDCQAA
jgi:hypothetical protein